MEVLGQRPINYLLIVLVTTCLVQWLAHLTAIQEVPDSIPGYTLEIFLAVQGLERGPPSLVRTIGQLLDMKSSEIRLRKLKLRLRDSTLPPVLPYGSNHFSRSWLFGAVAPQIFNSVGLGSLELQHGGINYTHLFQGNEQG